MPIVKAPLNLESTRTGVVFEPFGDAGSILWCTAGALSIYFCRGMEAGVMMLWRYRRNPVLDNYSGQLNPVSQILPSDAH